MMRIGFMVFLEYIQLPYHIIWPNGGDTSDLMDTIKNRLSCYPTGTEQVLVLDRYDDLSARDPERMRQAVKVLQPDHQQSTIKSGCYSQEQTQQAGAITGAVHLQPWS